MNRDARRINPNNTAAIDRVKGFILNAIEYNRGFDGDGYVFKTAVKQLRKSGVKITYNKEKCSYFGKIT